MRFLISEHTILPVINADGNMEWVEASNRRMGEAMAGVLWPDRDLILSARPEPEGEE